jgi:myo-inositol-1-phosphate synthase
MGAVATTLITGVLAAREGLGLPVGSLTQMGRIRLGKRTENRVPMIKDFIPLADLNEIVFGGWDLFEDDAYESSIKANVLDKPLLEYFRDQLKAIKPMKAVWDPAYIPNLDGTHVKSLQTGWSLLKHLWKI